MSRDNLICEKCGLGGTLVIRQDLKNNNVCKNCGNEWKRSLLDGISLSMTPKYEVSLDFILALKLSLKVDRGCEDMIKILNSWEKILIDKKASR